MTDSDSKLMRPTELRRRSCKRRLADHNARRQNGGRNYGTRRRAGRTSAAVSAAPASGAAAEAPSGSWGPPLTAARALNTALGQLDNSGSQGGFKCIDGVNGGYGPKGLVEHVHALAGIQPVAASALRRSPQSAPALGTFHPPPPPQLHRPRPPAAGEHPGPSFHPLVHPEHCLSVRSS